MHNDLACILVHPGTKSSPQIQLNDKSAIARINHLLLIHYPYVSLFHACAYLFTCVMIWCHFDYILYDDAVSTQIDSSISCVDISGDN